MVHIIYRHSNKFEAFHQLPPVRPQTVYRRFQPCSDCKGHTCSVNVLLFRWVQFWTHAKWILKVQACDSMQSLCVSMWFYVSFVFSSCLSLLKSYRYLKRLVLDSMWFYLIVCDSMPVLYLTHVSHFWKVTGTCDVKRCIFDSMWFYGDIPTVTNLDGSIPVRPMTPRA